MKKIFIGLTVPAVMSMGLTAWADSPIDGNWKGIIDGSVNCSDVIKNDPDYTPGNTVEIQNLIAKLGTDPSGATSYIVNSGTVVANLKVKGSNLAGPIYYGGWNLNAIILSTNTALGIMGNYYDPSASYPKGWLRTSIMPTGSCELYVDLYYTGQ